MNDQQKWTKEPWFTTGAVLLAGDYATEGEPDLHTVIISENPEADAHRAAVCVNALEGVGFSGDPTGAVRELVEAVSEAVEFIVLERVEQALARFHLLADLEPVTGPDPRD